MPTTAAAFHVLELTLPGSISYTALVGNTMQPMLSRVVDDYKRKIEAHPILIVDYRKGHPVLEPQEISDFFARTGDIWSRPEQFIYLYNDSNRMRTAHLSKHILMRGGRVVALPSWQAAAEHLGRDLGDDPLEALQA